MNDTYQTGYSDGYKDALATIKICLEEGMPGFQILEQIEDELKAHYEEEE